MNMCMIYRLQIITDADTMNVTLFLTTRWILLSSVICVSHLFTLSLIIIILLLNPSAPLARQLLCYLKRGHLQEKWSSIDGYDFKFRMTWWVVDSCQDCKSGTTRCENIKFKRSYGGLTFRRGRWDAACHERTFRSVFRRWDIIWCDRMEMSFMSGFYTKVEVL